MSYSDLLRDPRWQRKRLEVMQRDDFTCRECGDASTTLNVHHTYYAKGCKPWEYELDSFRTLCQPCHADVSEHLTEIQRLVGGLDSHSVHFVLGFVRALAVVSHWTSWAACGPHTPCVEFSDYEELSGVAAALRISEYDLEQAVGADGTSLNWEQARGIRVKQAAARKEKAAENAVSV